MNAPLVPDPSSRDNTLTYSLASKSVVAAGASSAVVSAVVSAAAGYHAGSAWNAIWGAGVHRIWSDDYDFFLDAACGYIKV